MKDNQEPHQKNLSSISSWNTFQTEWFKKIYRTLQITCGVKFLTLVVPLSKKLNISYFGTSVSEEFKTNDSFYHFSCLKKSAKNEIIKQVTVHFKRYRGTERYNYVGKYR
ncbi:unnamed protein product [Rhizophagus irregularis]|nr:unnamed protein product [Rhizophagus irregularis]